MLSTRRTILTTLASAALAASLGGTAAADENSRAFGDHVAGCAQTSLGQRDNPPAVSCSHEGMTMTFPNFGAMVQHMRGSDG